MTDPTPFDALRATKLAAELTDEQCRVLATLVTLRVLKQGEVLVQEGAVDNHLYVILGGTLGVIKNAGTDHAVTVNTLAQGDFVGEMGFMDGRCSTRPRSRSATRRCWVSSARSSSRCCNRIPKSSTA